MMRACVTAFSAACASIANVLRGGREFGSEGQLIYIEHCLGFCWCSVNDRDTMGYDVGMQADSNTDLVV